MPICCKKVELVTSECDSSRQCAKYNKNNETQICTVDKGSVCAPTDISNELPVFSPNAIMVSQLTQSIASLKVKDNQRKPYSAAASPGFSLKRVCALPFATDPHDPAYFPKVDTLVVLMGDPSIGCFGKLNNTWNPEDITTQENLLGILRKHWTEQSVEKQVDVASSSGSKSQNDRQLYVLRKHSTLVHNIEKIAVQQRTCGRSLLVLNLCDEGYSNDALQELHVPALLEMLNISYTGAGPACLAFCYDKGLVNATARQLGVPTAREACYLGSLSISSGGSSAATVSCPPPSECKDGQQAQPREKESLTEQAIGDKRSKNKTDGRGCLLADSVISNAGEQLLKPVGLQYPVFIKPMRGDNSLGITPRSLVASDAELGQYIIELAEQGLSDVLLQEYLPGGEYSVAVIGNGSGSGRSSGGGRDLSGYLFFPTQRVDYGRLPKGLLPILGFESKWDPSSPYWNDINYVECELGDKQLSELYLRCVVLFERFGCQDYARFDFRADANGEIKLLEVNPNPGWCWDGKMAKMAGMGGLGYGDMMAAILRVGWERVSASGTAQAAALQMVDSAGSANSNGTVDEASLAASHSASGRVIQLLAKKERRSAHDADALAKQ